MKKFLVPAALLPLCFAAACNVFFSNNTGEEGNVTLSLGEDSAYTGVFDDGAADFGDPPAAEGGGVLYPDLESPRISVYDASGKALRTYTFTGDSSSWKFSLPAGGPYWVDFSAPVRRPADPGEDDFPFVKSFGATVKVDQVEAGSSRDLFLPLRVRETAIMAPYMRGTANTTVWAPFYDLPAEYPASVDAVNRGNVEEDLSLDFDPYGGLLTTIDTSKKLYRIKNLRSKELYSNDLSGRNIAFNLRDGQIYYVSGDKKIAVVSPREQSKWWEDLLEDWENWLGSIFSNNDVSLAAFTIDEEGAFYTIHSDDTVITRTTHDGQSASFNVADIIDPAGQEWGANVKDRIIRDIKALNGYLYVILVVQNMRSEYYDYVAAVPLDAIKNGTGRAAWFVGGRSVDELHGGDNIDPDSLEGFFGPKKITGWGPERIYVYDYQENYWPEKRFRRIVEVDIRNRRISGAGLVVRQ